MGDAEAMKRPTSLTELPMSADTRKRNPGLVMGHAAMHANEPEKKRLRQPVRKVSRLEESFEVYLKSVNPADRVYAQFPLSLGAGCNYYLDFFSYKFREETGNLFFGYEVKGPHARSTGIVKLKVAARM